VCDFVSPDVCVMSSFSFQRFCSSYLYLFSTYVLNHMCFIKVSSVILCRLLSIIQILCHFSASELCLADAFDLLFSHNTMPMQAPVLTREMKQRQSLTSSVNVVVNPLGISLFCSLIGPLIKVLLVSSEAIIGLCLDLESLGVDLKELMVLERLIRAGCTTSFMFQAKLILRANIALISNVVSPLLTLVMAY
jgi:hypothetical protein